MENEKASTMTDETARPKERRGIFQRYIVERLDQSTKEGGKHHACRFFVLDADHDPFAAAALRAYATACRSRYPVLAHDLELLAAFSERRNPNSTKAV